MTHKTKLDDGTPIEVDYSARGGSGAVISLPWLSEPGEPPEIEIEAVYCVGDDDREVVLSDAERERIEEEICQLPDDELFPPEGPDDYRED